MRAAFLRRAAAVTGCLLALGPVLAGAAPRATVDEARAAVSVAAASYDLTARTGPMPTLDQGAHDWCLPYAWTVVAEYLIADHTGRRVRLDPGYTVRRGLANAARAIPAIYRFRSMTGRTYSLGLT